MLDVSKYEKGQIWKIHWNNPIHAGHEQQKDRPWLILSSGKFNQSSGMITAVPVTTRDTISSDSQVLFTNDRDVYNVILCEQVRSFDYLCGEYELTYMSTVSNEVLELVDNAIAFHLGLAYSPVTLRSLYDYLSNLITDAKDAVSHTKKFNEEDIKEFHSMLETAQAKKSNPEHIEDAKDAIHKKSSIVDIPGTPVNDKKPRKSRVESGPRIKWTPELCEEFVKDCDNLPMLEVMSKWNILKKSKFYYMRRYAGDLLTSQKKE